MSERDNRVLLRKAEMAVSDLTGGGLLVAEQADKFIVQAINQAVMLPMVNFHGMDAPSAEYPKLRFSSRVLHAGSENTPLPRDSWAKPALDQVALNVKKFKSEIRLSTETLEDQIEKGNFQQTLMTALTGAISRDMEHIAINGDTLSADPDLAQMDGWLKLASTNLVNVGGGTLTKLVCKNMLKQLEPAFRKNRNFKFFTHMDARADFKDSLSDRQTSLGDAMLIVAENDDNLSYNGRKIVEVDEFPEAAGTGYTQCLGADPMGLHMGVYRKIRLQVGEDLSSDTVIIVANVRFAVAIEEEAAVSKAYNIAIS